MGEISSRTRSMKVTSVLRPTQTDGGGTMKITNRDPDGVYTLMIEGSYGTCTYTYIDPGPGVTRVSKTICDQSR